MCMNWIPFVQIVIGTGAGVALMVTALLSARRFLRRYQPGYFPRSLVVASTDFLYIGVMSLRFTVFPMIVDQNARPIVNVVGLICGIAPPFLLMLSGRVCWERHQHAALHPLRRLPL